MDEQFTTPEDPSSKKRYHFEIGQDTNCVALYDRANHYLKERAHLDITIHDWRLQWLEGQYHLTLVLSIPIDEALA